MNEEFPIISGLFLGVIWYFIHCFLTDYRKEHYQRGWRDAMAVMERKARGEPPRENSYQPLAND